MQFDSNTPRATRTIAGISVQVIQPFAEGQPLTPALAAMLNQTLAENFSNNLRKALTPAEGAPEFTTETAQPIVDSYMAEYEPGVRSSGSGEPRVTDPVEREARKVAKEKVLEAISAKGGKAKDYDVAGLTSALFDKHRDRFMAEGKKIVALHEKAKNATSELDFEGIDIAPKPVAPAEPAAEEAAAA